MARRKRGRLVDGWLIVDKPECFTSSNVVGRARWAFDARKAGHAGTLDPLATGLLAVAFGEATKAVPYAQDGLKTYRFRVKWGEATTTDDREGEVCDTSPVRPSEDEIRAVLPRFTGDIMQRPPAFSAIKVGGERAYDLARRGDAPALAARPIHVERLSRLSSPDADHAEFEMVCGKGGYVRSVGRDLGEALGTRAHVVGLRRVASGAFSLEGAMTYDALEALRDDDARDRRLAPVEAGLAGMPRVDLAPDAAARLATGDASSIRPGEAGDSPVFWAACEGRVVAVCACDAGRVTIRRVFRLNAGD